MTTRFTSGVNNAENMTSLSNMPQPDPTRLYEVFDDFMGTLSTLVWTVVETQAGATQAQAAGAGGRLLLTNTATIADVNALATPLASFRLVAGKRFYAKVRVAVSDVANVNITFGFGNAATTLLPANGVYVSKIGTSITVNNANTSVVTSSTAFVDASGLAATQFCTLGLEYDGRSINVYYGQESTSFPAPDRKIGSVDAPNFNTGVDLLFFVGMKNVNAVANTATLDYAYAAMER